MSTIFRWHVSRIYVPNANNLDEPRVIHFKITPQAKDILAEHFGGSEAALAKVDSDDITWWNMDEKQEIEGRTSESLVIETMASKNVRKESELAERTLEKRQLEENMVLLQFVQDKAALKEALAKVKASCTGVADVSPLVGIENAGWLDFTQQSRTMASVIYREVLGEKEVSRNESQ
jgi:hypothetical protein